MTPRQAIRPLPARARPLSGESLVSLLRRTSWAMGYESPRRLAALLAERGKRSPRLNHLRAGPILSRAADLLLLSPEAISSLTVHHYAPALVLVRQGQEPPRFCDLKTVVRYFSASWPICPRCLRQDAVPYERLLWSFRPLPFCGEHGCLLVSRCPACRKPLRADRPDVARCRCGKDLGDNAPIVISSHGMHLTDILGRTLRGQIYLLPETPAATCFWWAERLAAAMSQTPHWLTQVGVRLGLEPQHYGETIAWLAAAEILADWPREMTTFLDAFQQVDKHRTTSTGVSRRFGLLLRQASRLEQMGYPAPANALRQYLLEHYAGGHLSGKSACFKRPRIDRCSDAEPGFLRLWQPKYLGSATEPSPSWLSKGFWKAACFRPASVAVR